MIYGKVNARSRIVFGKELFMLYVFKCCSIAHEFQTLLSDFTTLGIL